MTPMPETPTMLRLKAAIQNGAANHDLLLAAWKDLAASERARQRAEAALWFEHYGDVYPEARVDHGDCEACRCLAALAPDAPKEGERT